MLWVALGAGIDLQALILALQGGRMKLGWYLVEEFHRQVVWLQKKRSTLQIKVHWEWVPGHIGVASNEAVNEEAKQVAQSHSSPLHDTKTTLAAPLPWSKSAMIATFTKQTQQEWKNSWLISMKCWFLKKLDNTPLSSKTKKVYNSLSWHEVSILTQLQTAHVGLNARTAHHTVYGCKAMVPDGHGIIHTPYRIVILKALSALVWVPYGCLWLMMTVTVHHTSHTLYPYPLRLTTLIFYSYSHCSFLFFCLSFMS